MKLEADELLPLTADELLTITADELVLFEALPETTVSLLLAPTCGKPEALQKAST